MSPLKVVFITNEKLKITRSSHISNIQSNINPKNCLKNHINLVATWSQISFSAWVENKTKNWSLPWWSCPWPIPTLALRTSKSARKMSNFCPPPPDAGIILEVVHFFLRTCFYTILDSSTNFSRKKVTNFAAHHHNVCSCSQKLSAIIIKQRPCAAPAALCRPGPSW